MIGINLKHEVVALIVLEESNEYLFVETKEDKEIDHHRPKLVGGELHHMIAVRIEESMVR